MTDPTSCLRLRDIPLSAFADRLRHRVSPGRLPLDGSLELTFRCNLRCVHCYVSEPSCSRGLRRQELTTREILHLTDEVVDRGCLWMLLTGGEPLLRPDFPEIYLHMKRQGLLVTVFTNGTLLAPAVADLFAEWPPLAVEISIYGSTAGVHEAVTRVPGSFRSCLGGIERLLDRGVRLRLKTVPTRLNVHQMPDMRAVAAGYGLEFEWDPLVNCRVDACPGPASIRLSPEQIQALEAQDSTRLAHYRKEFARPRAPESHGRLFTCGAYLNSFHVDPYGNLLPCMLVRWPAYSLRDGAFREGWEEAFPRLRERPRSRRTRCDDCAAEAACDICPGWAQLETGDPEAWVPFLCGVAHARATAFAAVDGDRPVRQTLPRAGERADLREANSPGGVVGRAPGLGKEGAKHEAGL